MRTYEFDYNRLVSHVVQCGVARESRAGPTRQVFGTTLRINELTRREFPLLTARKMFPKPVLGELAAFLRGATNLQTYKDFGCNYWDANAAAWWPNKDLLPEEHEVGQIYGAQWRNWRRSGFDQLEKLIHGLIRDPYGRRHLLTTYDPAEEHACLPPCHLLAQYNVTNERSLDCCVYMRSVDLCLGLPSDVVLYAALLILLGHETDLHPGSLTFMLGDTHVYENHADVWVKSHASADVFPPPRYRLRPSLKGILGFIPDDLQLTGYHHGPKLEYPFNV